MIQKKRTSMHGGMDTSAVIVSRVSAPSNKSGAIRAICVSLIFLLAACGNSSSDKTGAQNTGSLSFSIKWVTKAKPGGATAGPNEAASVNCAALGVDKVWAALSGGPNTTVVALGGPWNCTDGQGTIPLSGIQTLNNVTLLIQGLNASGTVIYSGSQSGVFADGSKSQDGGTVTVSPVSGTYVALSSAALNQPFANYNSTGTGTSTGVVSTFAGATKVAGSTDATGTAAQFNNPQGITTVGTNLYVADAANCKIRKIVIATGAVTTFAGSVIGFTDGTGTAAQFANIVGITTDGTNLYVTEGDIFRAHIRKVVIATGVVTTLAGSAMGTGSTDGMGTAATFNSPQGITTDNANLYVADTGNHTIRKVEIATGVVTTFAGSVSAGSTDGTGTAARFYNPNGITSDGTNLYVTDTSNNTIRKVVIATGVVTTFAGSVSAGSTDGTGSAARFNHPLGITTDGTNLYVADNYNNTIRKIVIATGVVTTIAGSGVAGYADGASMAAQFDRPQGIAINGSDLYVADTNNQTIRKIQP